MEADDKRVIRIRLPKEDLGSVSKMSDDQRKKLIDILSQSYYKDYAETIVRYINVLLCSTLYLDETELNHYYEYVIELSQALLLLRNGKEITISGVKLPSALIKKLLENKIESHQTLEQLLEQALIRELKAEGAMFMDYYDGLPDKFVMPLTKRDAERFYDTDTEWPSKFKVLFNFDIDESPYPRETMVHIYRHYNGVFCGTDNDSLQQIIGACKEQIRIGKRHHLVKDTSYFAILLCFLKYKNELNTEDFQIIGDCVEILGLIPEEQQTAWAGADKTVHPLVSWLKSKYNELKKKKYCL